MTSRERCRQTYRWQYWLCSFLNCFTNTWKYGVVTKAWKEELEKGKGGLGSIIRVLKTPILGEHAGCNEILWVLHPASHDAHLKRCGLTITERSPVILNQAVVIPDD